MAVACTWVDHLALMGLGAGVVGLIVLGNPRRR